MTARAESDRQAGPTLVAVVGGVCAAFGVVLLFAAAAAAVAAWVGVDADMSVTRWRQAGWAATGGATLTLLAAFLLGGYMSGRSRGGAGAGNGLMVFVMGAAVMAAGAVAAAALVDIDLRASADSAGIPTFAEPWTTIGTTAAIAMGLAMLVGSLLGGVIGARHAPALVVRDTVPVRDEAMAGDRAEAIHLRDGDGGAARGGRGDGDGDGGRTERVVTHADGSMTTGADRDHAGR